MFKEIMAEAEKIKVKKKTPQDVVDALGGSSMEPTYLLLKNEPKEAFDLDCGLWKGLFREDVKKLSDVAATEGVLTTRIAEEVGDGVFGVCRFTQPSIDHWKRCPHCRGRCESVAKRLFDWCGDAEVRLVNDTEFEAKFMFTHLITQDVFV